MHPGLAGGMVFGLGIGLAGPNSSRSPYSSPLLLDFGLHRLAYGLTAGLAVRLVGALDAAFSLRDELPDLLLGRTNPMASKSQLSEGELSFKPQLLDWTDRNRREVAQNPDALLDAVAPLRPWLGGSAV
jgi:hypothetical protein